MSWATGTKRFGATSTITQQLARNIFLNSNRTFDRKLREAVLAMALESKFSKEQILELYLNKVYFGGGAYGIDCASRKFFSHPATELSTAEAAIIAGLVKAPSPLFAHRRCAGRRRPRQCRAAADARTGTHFRQRGRCRCLGGQAEGRQGAEFGPLFHRLGAAAARSAAARNLRTDRGVDHARHRDAARGTAAIKANAPDGAQGALVSLDRDGAILAMVGGTDYVATNYNRATDALRQPGSAWKLFVYLAALEAGYTPEDRVVDEPVTIDGWSPRNSGGRYAGEIDVRTAFAYSKNTVAAQLGNEVGFGTVASMARRFGITTPISTYPSMVLGTFGGAPDRHDPRLCRGVGEGGTSVEPYGIVKVTTADGEVLYQHEDARRTQLVPDYVAAGITDLLQTAVNTGTGRPRRSAARSRARPARPVRTRMAGSSAFPAGSPPACGWAATMPRRSPGLQGGARPGAGLRRLYALCGEGPAGRGIRHRTAAARMAARAGRGILLRRSGRLLLHRRAGQSDRAGSAAAGTAARCHFPSRARDIRRRAAGRREA